MYVEELNLKNFRNYDSVDVNPGKGLNIFIGSNAQGKTNILESIYLLSTGKSHRTQKDKDLIKWNREKAYAGIKFIKQSVEYKIETLLTQSSSAVYKINGMKTNKTSELAGVLNVVMFSPEDLRLVKDGPAIRRKFLDTELNQLKPSYLHNMYQYNRVLMQRNNILKQQYLTSENRMAAEVFGEQLSKYGSYICFTRNEFIKKLSLIARLIHRKITNGKEELEISYDCSMGQFEQKDEIKNSLYRYYIEKLDEDHEKGVTLKGPHRDDLIIKINGVDARAFGSQGQQRTAALSLKLSELEIIKGETGEYPVLLLDDVMSELDSKRQKFLLDTLKEIQTIVTCTSIMDIQQYHFEMKDIFIVDNGNIKKADKNNEGKMYF